VPGTVPTLVKIIVSLWKGQQGLECLALVKMSIAEEKNKVAFFAVNLESPLEISLIRIGRRIESHAAVFGDRVAGKIAAGEECRCGMLGQIIFILTFPLYYVHMFTIRHRPSRGQCHTRDVQALRSG
jgi:hypothetical protein